MTKYLSGSADLHYRRTLPRLQALCSSSLVVHADCSIAMWRHCAVVKIEIVSTASQEDFRG